MAYFPFFVDLLDQKGLIVGGGTVALRKAEKLLPYGPRLTAAAPEFIPEFERISGITLLRQEFEPSLLTDCRFAVAATDDRELNRAISRLCREQRVLVNTVDDREACSFIFPALVREGSLSIGISTGGASPSAAIYLKEQIQELLPENAGELLAWLESLRDRIKREIPEERRRAAFFSRLFRACMGAGKPLNETELQALLPDFLPEEAD